MMLRAISICYLFPAILWAQQTVAEKSDFRATSRGADVVAFGETLAKTSKRIRLSEIGKSNEGRSIPLWILGDPAVSTPEEAVAAKKLVVMAFANIHAGEVDGKEALQMLAREWTTTPPDWLKDVVVLFVPNFNVDGNERIDRKHRTEQNGPAEGVGIRENADGYDLNRDFVKLETPEVRALVSTITRWDPSVVIDLHTTNGSYHRYTLTYDGPRNPAADPALITRVRDRWFPAIGAEILKTTGYHTGFYGNFTADRAKWESYPAVPRFGVQWLAISNRIGVLSESYTYASFRDRILSGKAFTAGIIEYAATHRDEVAAIRTAAMQPRARIALKTKVVSLGERTILGYVEEGEGENRKPTKVPKDYKVALEIGVEETFSVERPAYYFVPKTCKVAIETLGRHGIALKELTEDREIESQIYRVLAVDLANREFQKHRAATVEVARRDATWALPAGTVVVSTKQPLGQLAGYLLEPQSEDGLTTWNAFDDTLRVGQDFPVIRAMKDQKLPLKDRK
jgi:dipeptidyl-peptidase 4